MKLGFLGCGSLGRALLDGWLAAEVVSPAEVTVADPYTAQDLAQTLGVTAGTSSEVVDVSDVVLLAVKPHHLDSATDGLAFREDQVVVSVLAGVPLARVAARVHPATVVRVMPNVAARVGHAVTFVLEGPRASVGAQLFGAVGHVEPLTDEDHFHVGTALAGSGPAYIFVAIEALADAAVARGLPRAAALRVAAHTVAGAGLLAATDGRHPAQLKDAVASPGGTTIYALRALERAGFRAALVEAVLAAAHRSEELADP